jgi:hypothetical protein
MTTTKQAKRGRPTKQEAEDKKEAAKWKYKETELVKDSGIPKQVFKQVRERLPKSEYKSQKGATTMYSESGLGLILKFLGLRRDDLNLQHDRQWAILTRTQVRNSYIVIGEMADGKDTPVTIRVGRSGNGNFKTGMVVPVRGFENGVAVLDRKNPRAKGVW